MHQIYIFLFLKIIFYISKIQKYKKNLNFAQLTVFNTIPNGTTAFFYLLSLAEK
jgi:hypothetical protein